MHHKYNSLEDGSSRQLDAIKSGGEQIIIIVRQRLADAFDAMEGGDFMEAHSVLNEAASFMASLSHAQQFIAVADGSRLIEAVELEVGMTITNVGEVNEVVVEECPACRTHIMVKVGEHPFEFHGNRRIYVDLPD